MRKLKTFFLATRPQFVPASIIPVALGASTAWETAGAFDPFPFILSLIAAVFFHSGMNVFNDYFDHINGTDDINKKALTPFTGGSRFIQRGLLTPKETLVLAVLLVSAGSLIGFYLAYTRTWLLLLIGGAGLFSGFFYSAPPLFLAGKGLGEITVGVNFGVLTVLGSYMVQTGGAGVEPLFASLPVSFLISALLYINEFPDYEADRDSGKKTLVVRLGPAKGRLLITLFLSGAYLSVVAGVAFGFLPVLSLVSLLSLIFSIPAAIGLMRNYKGGAELIPSIKSIILAHLSAGILLIGANLF